jgi:hypothetical protein
LFSSIPHIDLVGSTQKRVLERVVECRFGRTVDLLASSVNMSQIDKVNGKLLTVCISGSKLLLISPV